MNIVMLARTPLAGSPYEACKCINKYTDHRCRLISVQHKYPDGRDFPYDLDWCTNTAECLDLIRSADVIHLHNEEFAETSEYLSKPMVVQFHSVPVRPQFLILRDRCAHCFTLDQPLQKLHYGNIPALPNLIDPDEYKPKRVPNDIPRIVFAPTNNWDAKEPGSKATSWVTGILGYFRGRCDVDIFSNVPYEENLKRKCEADIIIDDVVGNTFHRTSLEGACYGLAVITSYATPGFIFSDMGSLEMTLERLYRDRAFLQISQANSRRWIETEWHPKNLVQRYIDAYKEALK